MPHLPDRARFADLARTSRLVPVYRRLFADSLTPLTAYARLDDGAAGCLFESVVGGENVGRHSFLAADPFLRMEARGREVRVTGPSGVESLTCDDPLAELERRMAAFRPARLAELPPFTSGTVGCVAYDAVRYVERLPNAPPDDLGLPDLSFAFYDRMVVFDHVTKGVDVVVLGGSRAIRPPRWTRPTTRRVAGWTRRSHDWPAWAARPIGGVRRPSGLRSRTSGRDR